MRRCHLKLFESKAVRCEFFSLSFMHKRGFRIGKPQNGVVSSCFPCQPIQKTEPSRNIHPRVCVVCECVCVCVGVKSWFDGSLFVEEGWNLEGTELGTAILEGLPHWSVGG